MKTTLKEAIATKLATLERLDPDTYQTFFRDWEDIINSYIVYGEAFPHSKQAQWDCINEIDRLIEEAKGEWDW